MGQIIVAKTLDFQEVFVDILHSISSEQSVWMPDSDARYISGVLAQHLKFPNDLSGLIKRLHDHIPRAPLRRYDCLKNIGDLIVYFHLYWGVPSCIGTRAHAQSYYDDASHIGRRIHEPQAPVLEQIAFKLDDYEPILSEARKRLAA